ncbi:MAG: hypothetical protein SVX43_02645 [Cyanobacteriota bacterium]|nr:hypothetical protein [Cyanobacteriota bacterium]
MTSIYRKLVVTATEAVIAGVLFTAVAPANAAIIVGGISFDDNAFADSIISANFSGSIFPSGNTLQEALLGSNINSHADTSPGNFFELGFEDNFVLNGPGNDLAVSLCSWIGFNGI